MKIITNKLTPLFDQYSNNENRLTHALLHTIGGSERILRLFLKKVIGLKGKMGVLEVEVSTQKRPFSHEDTDPDKVDSVPDAWIITPDSKLGIVVEVKDVKNNVRFGQLRSHIKRLEGYDARYLLVITPDSKEPVKIPDIRQSENADCHVVWISWNDIYRVFKKWRDTNFQSMPKEQFILNSMLEYLEHRREVLGFQGIFFNKGFDVDQAKIILKTEMDEVSDTVQELFPALTSRRPAVTTALSKSSVWDCFGKSKGFTNDIHITFSLHEDYHDISLTVPHNASQRWKQLKSVFQKPSGEQKIISLMETLRNKVPNLFLEYHQRHFLFRKKGVKDAFLEFNIDTFGLPFSKRKSNVKEFPIWYEVFKSAVVKKSKINAQVAFKIRFYYFDTKGMDKEGFLKTVKITLEAIKPLYLFLTQKP